MISQTAEYALRAIVYLAGQDQPRTTAQMSEVTHVPAGYLAKVMQQLGRAGLVRSQRGLKGGFTLAGEPEAVTVLEVINAVDPIRRFPECPLGIPSHGRRLCPLHFRLDQAAQLVVDALGETKVAELLDAPRRQRSPCRFPAEAELVS
jgi:Rrf2 family protein